MENQYYINYEIEFIKRGFLGHIFFLVDYNVFFLKFIFFGVFILINYLICSQKFILDNDILNNFKEILLKIFFISTPAITAFYKWSFILDIYVFVTALILTLSIIKYKLWISTFLIIFLSVIGILIHEIFASYYFLLLLSIFTHRFRNTIFIIPLSFSIFSIFITMFYLLVLKYGSVEFENIKIIENSLPNKDIDFINFMSSSIISDFKIFFSYDQNIKIVINLLFILPSIYCFYLIITDLNNSKSESEKKYIFLILFFCLGPVGNIFVALDHSRFIFAILNNLVLANIYFLKVKLIKINSIKNNILVIIFLAIILNLLIGPSDTGNPPVNYYKFIQIKDFLFKDYLHIYLL
tara:strand:- start:372 stop:1427 length:1056 start_codon:yes stop_codon:yes gene_type:complete